MPSTISTTNLDTGSLRIPSLHYFLAWRSSLSAATDSRPSRSRRTVSRDALGSASRFSTIVGSTSRGLGLNQVSWQSRAGECSPDPQTSREMPVTYTMVNRTLAPTVGG